MTAEPFQVDDDLLADFVGGALDGTPEQARIAQLIEEDPTWAEAYAELAQAVDRVQRDLAEWGATAPTMPAAVADRLTAALAAAGPVPAPAVAARPEGGSPRTVAVAGVPPRGREAAGPGRRRWARRAGPALVAAVVVAVAGFGAGQLLLPAEREPATTTALREDDAAERAAEGSAGGFRLATEPRRSGITYTPQTLTQATAGPGILSGAATPDSAADPRRPASPTLLDRLTDPAALDACLSEVSAAHGRGPVTVDRVEYAAFAGQPALVVGLVDETGQRWVWVTGAGCGLAGSGADTRFSARVG